MSGGALRELIREVADDLKKKAETNPEAELEAKLRLENKRKEKAFHDASPLGGLYETASGAGHEGEDYDVPLRWRVEAIEADYFVTPMAEFRLEDHEAGPMPSLKRWKGSRAYSPRQSWRHMEMGFFLQMRKQTRALYIFRFLKYVYISLYSGTSKPCFAVKPHFTVTDGVRSCKKQKNPAVARIQSDRYAAQ